MPVWDKNCDKILQAAHAGDVEGVRALTKDVDIDLIYSIEGKVPGSFGSTKTLLIDAIHSSRETSLTACRTLLAAGADIDGKDGDGDTPLVNACEDESTLEKVRFLLSEGADINARGHSGYTPLLIAAYFHQKNIVKLLLQYRPDVNAVNDYGISALMYLVHNKDGDGCIDIVLALLNAGADKTIKDKRDATAETRAIKCGNYILADYVKVNNFRDRLARIQSTEHPPHLLCPISCDLMNDPVTLSSGHTFDRVSIYAWYVEKGRQEQFPCPLSKRPVACTELMNASSFFVKEQLRAYVETEEAKAQAELISAATQDEDEVVSLSKRRKVENAFFQAAPIRRSARIAELDARVGVVLRK